MITAVKERPIIFSGEEARAVLEGRKSQFRRVIDHLSSFGPITEFDRSDTSGYDWHFRDRRMNWNDVRAGRLMECCPFAKPGDLLWVRETWRTGWSYGFDYQTVQYHATQTAYVGDEDHPVLDVMAQKFGIADNMPYSILPGGRWKPSTNMPRWASRILLEIVSVRVERLQDISEEDAKAEGVPPLRTSNIFPPSGYQDTFMELWDTINAKRGHSWESNCWVWVVEFKVIEGAR